MHEIKEEEKKKAPYKNVRLQKTNHDVKNLMLHKKYIAWTMIG